MFPIPSLLTVLCSTAGMCYPPTPNLQICVSLTAKRRAIPLGAFLC
jgi:hypothetical protein